MVKHLPKEYKLAVEVGVREGHFSRFILDNTNMDVHSVDPWTNNAELSHADAAFECCKNMLQPYGNRSKMIRTESIEAVKMYENESVDFVYIDALHDYESVSEDLHTWWPKVRKGGVIAGHDFNDLAWPGVYDAVVTFAMNKCLPIYHINRNMSQQYDRSIEDDGNQPSWLIAKPNET